MNVVSVWVRPDLTMLMMTGSSTPSGSVATVVVGSTITASVARRHGKERPVAETDVVAPSVPVGIVLAFSRGISAELMTSSRRAAASFGRYDGLGGNTGRETIGRPVDHWWRGS